MFKACNNTYDDILVDSFYPTTFLFLSYDVIERSTYEHLAVLSVLVSQPALRSHSFRYILEKSRYTGKSRYK